MKRIFLHQLSMWFSLMDRRREHELRRTPRWKKFWKAIQKKDAKETEDNLKVSESAITRAQRRRRIRSLMGCRAHHHL
jgi:ribosomal protein S20